ncbi:MAG: response regulator [Chloroflexi bacterium]|nr:response regulator [Chloroflexota bacterium]MBP8054368.1 response regulator [Chloroflexota bacterium]
MSKKILCIEDNNTNLILVSRIVDAEGHDLLSAENGLVALELLGQETPDLILLDINMPGINGLELAGRIKSDPRLRRIPLIATTANVLVGDRERCLEAGCDDYLPKPLDIRKLRELMRVYLAKAETERISP